MTHNNKLTIILNISIYVVLIMILGIFYSLTKTELLWCSAVIVSCNLVYISNAIYDRFKKLN